MLTIGCFEKDEFAIPSDSANSIEITTDYGRDQSIFANNKIEIDTSLFSTDLLSPKQKEKVKNIQSRYSKSVDDLDTEKTGNPVWGAIMEKGGISIIPTLRPNSNLSYEFIAIYPNGQSNEFRYFNSLNSEDPLNFIGFLTFSILTEQSKQDIFPQGGITITDLDIDTEGAIPQNKNGTDCSLIVVTSETCISVSQNRVGSFCCKCTESTSSSLLCETVGGGGGYRPPTSGSTFGGGGGGGGGGNNNNNNNNNDFEGNFDLSKLNAYLDSMRNVAPDQIVNNVDCAAEPCLCEVIDQFSVNPANLENLSNEVSQLLQTIFAIPNFQRIIITTSDVEGITIDLGTIATHTTGGGGSGFPISGMAYSEIIFNSNYPTNCTKAHLASTLLHESIHAYIETQKLALIPADFNRIYPLYSREFDSNTAHHNLMATRYFVALSQSLSNMFPDLTDEYVEALTWQGLEGTYAYDNLIASKPLGFGDRIREIQNIASCKGDIYSPNDLEAMGLEPCF